MEHTLGTHGIDDRVCCSRSGHFFCSWPEPIEIFLKQKILIPKFLWSSARLSDFDVEKSEPNMSLFSPVVVARRSVWCWSVPDTVWTQPQRSLRLVSRCSVQCTKWPLKRFQITLPNLQTDTKTDSHQTILVAMLAFGLDLTQTWNELGWYNNHHSSPRQSTNATKTNRETACVLQQNNQPTLQLVKTAGHQMCQ